MAGCQAATATRSHFKFTPASTIFLAPRSAALTFPVQCAGHLTPGHRQIITDDEY